MSGWWPCGVSPSYRPNLPVTIDASGPHRDGSLLGFSTTNRILVGCIGLGMTKGNPAIMILLRSEVRCRPRILHRNGHLVAVSSAEIDPGRSRIAVLWATSLLAQELTHAVWPAYVSSGEDFHRDVGHFV